MLSTFAVMEYSIEDFLLQGNRCLPSEIPPLPFLADKLIIKINLVTDMLCLIREGIRHVPKLTRKFQQETEKTGLDFSGA
jgi:hypothetical protein